MEENGTQAEAGAWDRKQDLFLKPFFNFLLHLNYRAAVCDIEQIGGQAIAVPRVIVNPAAKTKPHHTNNNLKTAATATSLTASRVGWGRGNILDSANLHAGSSESAERGLSTWAGGLGAVT